MIDGSPIDSSPAMLMAKTKSTVTSPAPTLNSITATS
jgi:hypothetical protein